MPWLITNVVYKQPNRHLCLSVSTLVSFDSCLPIPIESIIALQRAKNKTPKTHKHSEKSEFRKLPSTPNMQNRNDKSKMGQKSQN